MSNSTSPPQGQFPLCQRTKQISNKIFVVTCREFLAEQADFLLDLFADVEHENGPLRNGAKIQVGWTILIVKEREGHEGQMEIVAPDYDTNPFTETNRDLSVSLYIQMAQNHCLQTLQLTGEAALFQDKIVVAKGALEEEHVYLQRAEQREAGDSGWYLGPVRGEVDSDGLESYYIFQLLKHRPSLLQALALPRGYIAVFRGDQIEAVLDEHDENVWPTLHEQRSGE
ncbi:hypothetical protein AAFJ72_16600 [Brevibacillus gelatini]|uniref:Imm33-like domain-containing protein n=1 Tax=Brevibacillus gelatini TaxID=1655277 RepID=A0A3M8ANC3_9BACL|nr:hypothetical protein [Brevibacillus gelatini]RNB51995.1 hypothetical protein EDM57_21990 [Brevibacillus gelatini]